jgi:hypothetical protein
MNEKVKSGIQITKVWFDEDVIELKVDVSDGTSFFSTNVYVGYQQLDDTISGLDVFKGQVHGGLFNIRWGEFGLEYANGAFYGRLHFARPGKLYITCRLQSDFKEFSLSQVASEATLFLRTEPVLLDNFISELKALNANRTKEAKLETI